MEGLMDVVEIGPCAWYSRSRVEAFEAVGCDLQPWDVAEAEG